MEIQLQELIEQIKKDGVASAEAEAEKIIAAAKAEAEKIVASAKAEASGILRDAKAETERMTKSGEDAIRQAGRNLLITFRESVGNELRAIVGEKVEAVYASDALAKMIEEIVVAWANKPEAEDLAVIVNEETRERLENALLSALKARMSNGVTLKTSEGLDKGFRIAVSEGSIYYDYSAEAVVEMLSNYLSPRVTALLKEAN